MITIQHNCQYVTRNGRRVRTERRMGVGNWNPYKFYAFDMITDHRYSITSLGREYDDRSSGNDLVEKIQREQEQTNRQGEIDVSTNSLSNLKQKSDNANEQYLNALRELQNSLPEGIKLMIGEEEFDGKNIGTSQENVRLLPISSRHDVGAGTTLRLTQRIPETGSNGRRRKIENLTVGRDYQVTHIDGHGDPQITGNDGSRVDTANILQCFSKVVRSNGRTQWVVLTQRNRDNISKGTRLRATRNFGDGLTDGKIYTVTHKPDNDGRFVGDDGMSHDTAWFYDGELEIEISL